jgi:hypothetical protein
MKGSILLLFTLVVYQYVFSQSISSTVDKQKILIGEPFQWKLQGASRGGRGPSLPSFDSIPHFEILSKSKVDSQQSERGLILSQTYTLTSWDSGRWVMPAFGPVKTVAGLISIEVGYTPQDPAQPYNDIKDIIPVKRPTQSTWYWYVIGALVLIGLFLLFFPKEKKKEPAAAPVFDEGAYKEALKKLERLKAEKSQEAKLFYTELIDIFREYLMKRKNIQSFSQTTEDLARKIGQLSLDRSTYFELVQTLQLSDMVKFARYQPAIEENNEALEKIKKSIVAIENLN